MWRYQRTGMSPIKSIKNTKIQEFFYGDKTNVEYEFHDFIGNNWSHRNGNKVFN